VRVDVDPVSGQVTYWALPGGNEITARVWHIRGFTLPGQQIGLSPIAYAAQAIGVDLSSRKFARDFFDGGGVPKATLTTDLDLTQEQADTAKQRLRAATVNREPAVFGNGVKYTPISVKPEESQFLQTQQANIVEIARFFGVPAEMVGGQSGSSLTYSNVEQRSLDFLTYGVQFWLKRIEDAFFDLLPQPQFVQFNTKVMLRTDAETQSKVDAIDIAAKMIAPSEKRTARNLPPLTQQQKEELELIPLTINPGTGLPKSLPQPPTPATADDVPNVNPTKPRLEAVNG
jgi:HK97 family phage portal protein